MLSAHTYHTHIQTILWPLLPFFSTHRALTQLQIPLSLQLENGKLRRGYEISTLVGKHQALNNPYLGIMRGADEINASCFSQKIDLQ
jgi:hypothetical protein